MRLSYYRINVLRIHRACTRAIKQRLFERRRVDAILIFVIYAIHLSSSYAEDHFAVFGRSCFRVNDIAAPSSQVVALRQYRRVNSRRTEHARGKKKTKIILLIKIRNHYSVLWPNREGRTYTIRQTYTFIKQFSFVYL